jgi:hypothetical protein
LFIIFAQNNNSAIPLSSKSRITTDWLIRAEINENQERKKWRDEKYAQTSAEVLKIQMH